MHTSENLKYWLALNQAPHIGPVGFRTILDHANSPLTFFENLDTFLGQLNFRESTRQYLLSPDWKEIEQSLLWASQPNNHILCFEDSRYPKLLREISDAPPLIYVHGDVAALDAPQIAIVGSRNPSRSGKEIAFDFAAFLASQGFVITSGLALGIDYESHRGALAAQASTIAVVGTGPDRIYPARHKNLAHQIADTGGALVSELKPGTPAKPENFPRRNRIISGLSLGTLVVEAANQSGSLITARLAAEQGREVFAIPGSIHNPLSKGCHSLIRQGAKLVEKAEHIIEELGQMVDFVNLNTNYTIPKSQIRLEERFLRVLDFVDYEPTSIDVLIQRSGLTPENVSSMLLELEMQGYVENLPGGTYARIR